MCQKSYDSHAKNESYFEIDLNMFQGHNYNLNVIMEFTIKIGKNEGILEAFLFIYPRKTSSITIIRCSETRMNKRSSSEVLIKF